MNSLCELLYVSFLATDLWLAASSRLMHCIRLVMIQGILLGLLPFFQVIGQADGGWCEAWVTGSLNLVLKGIVIPWLLAIIIRKINVRRELEPICGYSLSCLITLGCMALIFILCRRFEFGNLSSSRLFAPVAISTTVTGLFLMIFRKKALVQVLGFLVFENGITLFGSSLKLENGLLVEMGILLDVLVLVFIMGIALYQINREFRHIDTDRLNQLGDRANAGEDLLKEEEAR